MSEKKKSEKRSGSNGKIWFGFTEKQLLTLYQLLQARPVNPDSEITLTLNELLESFKRRVEKRQRVAPQISK